MLRVDKGRMGHREAYWPLDQRRGECETWAKRKKRPQQLQKIRRIGQCDQAELKTYQKMLLVVPKRG